MPDIVEDAQRLLENANKDPEAWDFWLKNFGSSLVSALVTAREENEKLRAFIAGVKEFDPRSDIYATGLMDECNDILGLCRCCGQEVCDDD